jgi:uncharacterized Zn-binding protein involved in type VI secretion
MAEAIEKYADNCYSRGPWDTNQKVIMQAAKRVSRTRRCGWYISSKMMRKVHPPEFVPDYGGAECRPVKIRIRQDNTYQWYDKIGSGSKLSFGLVSESKGELAYAKDFQDFYLTNNKEETSDSSELLYASGSVTHCYWKIFSAKCKTFALSRDDFHMRRPNFGFDVQYPPDVLIANVDYSGPYIRVEQLPAKQVWTSFNSGSVSPADIQLLTAEGSITLTQHHRSEKGSIKVVIQIELLGGGKGGLARVGDAVDGGGKIIEGAATVFVNSKPAARRGDRVAGGKNGEQKIITGSETVFMEGQIAARAFDVTDSGEYISEGSQNTTGGDRYRNKEEEDLRERASELAELEAEMLNALDEKRQIEKELKLEREQVKIYQRQIEGHYDSKGDPGTPFGVPGMGAYGALNIDAARRKVEDLEKRLAENEKHILTLWGRRDALEGSQW